MDGTVVSALHFWRSLLLLGPLLLVVVCPPLRRALASMLHFEAPAEVWPAPSSDDAAACPAPSPSARVEA
jgi:hypothetical protein